MKNERIKSLTPLFFVGLQHVLVMYTSAVMVPLILGLTLGLSPKDLTYIISADLFTCGIATLLQSAGFGKFIGIKLPVIMGCTPIALFPMITTGKIYGIPAIYGSIIAGGLFVFFAAPLFQKISRLFPPIVVGTVITVIGLTLITVGANNIASATGPVNHSLILAAIVIVSVILINKFCKNFLQNIAMSISLLIGAVIVMYSIVTAYGIRICSKVDFNNHNNLIVVAVPIGIALAISLEPQLFKGLSDWLKILFGNGVIAGSVMAVIINFLLNGVKQNYNEN